MERLTGKGTFYGGAGAEYGATAVMDLSAKARVEAETLAQWLGPEMARAVGKLALKFGEEWGDGKPCGAWEAVEAIVRDRLVEEGLVGGELKG